MSKEYISTAEAAIKLNRHKTLIRKWCRQGRIEGAFQVGRDWVVPSDVERPAIGRAGRRWNPENLEKKLEPIADKMVRNALGKS